MKLFLISLGCAKNLVDSETITRGLTESGYTITDKIEKAGLILINTCGFINDAKQESIDTVLSVLEEKNSDAKLVVFGCLVQRYRKELEGLIPEVDLFLPVLSEGDFRAEILASFPPEGGLIPATAARILFTPPAYTYIKISEGCRNRCSYCTIPMIRGPLRSVPARDIKKQIEEALDRGVYEFNLIAQDLTAYGSDLDGKTSLAGLLKRILSIKKDFWLRLLYLYPSRINTEIAGVMRSDSRIQKYIDMPIQHSCSRILKLMNRHYTREVLYRKIDMLRKKIPSIAIRTSLIVGFPSENDADFRELSDFVRDIEFEHLGVFEYSEEEDTKAVLLRPLVPVPVKRERRRLLMNIQKKIVKERSRAVKGKIYPCLMEMPVDEYGAVWTGRIYSQAPEVDGTVYVAGYTREMGAVVDVKIEKSKDYDYSGICVAHKPSET